jgi:hypothetical protein
MELLLMKTARQPLTYEKRIYETDGKKYDVLAILSGLVDRDKVHHESCLLCGFKIPNAGHSYLIHMLNGGFGDDEISLLRCDIPELWNGYPSQGGFPIGSECRKKLPAEFTFKISDWK